MKKVICDYCNKESDNTAEYILPDYVTYEAKDSKGNIVCKFASKEEQESVNRYIESISKPIDINFFDLLDGKDVKMEDYIRTKADEMINSFKQGCIKKGISFSKENETFMRTGMSYGISLASMGLSQLPGGITLPDNE